MARGRVAAIKMDVPSHFFITLLVSIILFPFLGHYALITIVGGVFIDIDHYFWYVYKFRKFGIIKSYKFHKDKPFLGRMLSIYFILLNS